MIDYYNKRITPNIVKIPNSSANARNRPYYSDAPFCDFCGMRMVYARQFHAYYCNQCGNSIDAQPKHPHRQQRQPQPQEKQPQQPDIETQSDETLDLDVKYSTTDGITDDELHNDSTIGSRSSSSKSRRGITRAYQFNNKHKTDFERVCAEEDRQMQEKGWQITSDTIYMPPSQNILDLTGGDKIRQLGSNSHVRIKKY